MIYQTINYLCGVQAMARLKTEVNQTSTITNGTCHQRLIRLYHPTNKKGIVSLTVMAKQTAGQSVNIFLHFNSKEDMHMVGLCRRRRHI